LKKQEKLRSYQAAKEEKARLVIEKELLEKQAIDDAERDREMKRVKRALKQKEKIKDYSVKIKTEAETIQELIALGIDPASLLNQGNSRD